MGLTKELHAELHPMSDEDKRLAELEYFWLTNEESFERQIAPKEPSVEEEKK